MHKHKRPRCSAFFLVYRSMHHRHSTEELGTPVTDSGDSHRDVTTTAPSSANSSHLRRLDPSHDSPVSDVTTSPVSETLSANMEINICAFLAERWASGCRSAMRTHAPAINADCRRWIPRLSGTWRSQIARRNTTHSKRWRSHSCEDLRLAEEESLISAKRRETKYGSTFALLQKKTMSSFYAFLSMCVYLE